MSDPERLVKPQREGREEGLAQGTASGMAATSPLISEHLPCVGFCGHSAVQGRQLGSGRDVGEVASIVMMTKIFQRGGLQLWGLTSSQTLGSTLSPFRRYGLDGMGTVNIC